MRDDSFAIAVQNLKTAGPDKLLVQLQALFYQITQMDADQTVAAHQAVSFLATILDKDQGLVLAKKIEQALVNNMSHLISQAPIEYRYDMRSRFVAVTGRTGFAL